MTDWYLGQAGFGEQIQLYGETFWRQVGSTLLWAFIAIWAVLMFVAIIVTLSRQADVNEEMGSARRLDELLHETHTGSLRPRQGSNPRGSTPPRHRAA
jgi:hypothetical protein